MKNAYYFSHDYTAREDEKIKNLIYKHDWYGYGLYWAIIEQLYANEGYLEPNYKRIAHDLRTNEETIKSIIEEFNLFDFADGMFTSCSVLRRLNKQKSLSRKRQKAAVTKWKKHYAIALQMQSNCNAIKESKVKESKVNNKKENKEKSTSGAFAPTPAQTMETFISSIKEKNVNYFALVEKLKASGIPEAIIYAELDKFINYWTEKGHNGKKQRWEYQKVFEVPRRLTTWFNNCSKFSGNKQSGTPFIN